MQKMVLNSVVINDGITTLRRLNRVTRIKNTLSQEYLSRPTIKFLDLNEKCIAFVFWLNVTTSTKLCFLYLFRMSFVTRFANWLTL